MSFLLDNLGHLAALSVLVPIVFSAITASNGLNRILKVLTFYLVSSFATDAVCFYRGVNGQSSNSLFNVFTLLEIISIVCIFYLQYNDKKVFPVFLTIFLGFLFWFTATTIYYGTLNYDDQFFATVAALTIILLSLIHFFRIISDLTIPVITDSYFFWLNTAFLLYFSADLFLFLFDKYILSAAASPIVKNLWLLHNASNIIYNCLLAKAFYQWKMNRT